jgi:Protein of unknown function (DUF992)
MRWWLIVLVPMFLAFDARSGSDVQTELGVLSCTLVQVIDSTGSDQKTAASEAREMVCFFLPGTHGPQEAYAGTVRSIGVVGKLPDRFTLLWIVKGPLGAQSPAGLLQQSYAVDDATPVGQVPPLVGDRNNKIVLHAMADKREGPASQEKQPRPDFILTGVELILRASTS